LTLAYETKWEHTGLIAGDTYKFKVRAVNSCGYSPFSNTILIIGGELAAVELPNTVTNVKISTQEDRIMVADTAKRLG
jgi:hypothetical protein